MIPDITFPQARPLRVFCCIPNIGHTAPLAYDNRLVWFLRQGVRETHARWIHTLYADGGSTATADLIEAVTGKPAADMIAQHRTWYEFHSYTVGDVLTPFAREVLVEKGLAADPPPDLFFMVDDDMVGDPDTFFQLAESVVHGPADICGALAFTRGAPHNPVLYRQLNGYDLDRRPYVKNRSVERYPRNSLVECDAVGFGAVVFTADIARRMTPPRFMNTTGSGEDIFFCYKAREDLKARVFSDTRVKLGHMGHKPIITEETYEGHRARVSHGMPDELPAVEMPPTWGVPR